MTGGSEELCLELQARGLDLTPRERAVTERSFWFTLGKYQPELRRVALCITAPEGEETGWVRCRVSVHDRAGATMLVEGADPDLAACVTRTFQRAEREVRRRSIRVRRRTAARPGGAD